MLYADNTSYTIAEKITATTPIILPIGAVEAHGPHLPLDTDNILAEAYCKKISTKVDGLVLPTLPFGQVWSLKNFPGSLSISNETIVSLILELADGLFQQGSRLFILISGHLGNMTALKDAARKIVEKHPEMRVLHIFYPNIQGLAKKVREGNNSHHTYIHACEIETSLMLYLAPGVANMNLAIDDDPQIPPSADFRPTPWEEFTSTAVLGEATLATFEKGEFLIEETLKSCVELIQEEQKMIHEME